MGIMNLFAQSQSFASRLKDAIGKVEQEADKDPDTFKANMERMEKEWGGRKDPVERSVVHALFASAYKEMTWTSISDYDEETRTDYGNKVKEHFTHVLDDMDALASAKADYYKVLIEKGKDNDVYGHDMLSVMLPFAISNSRWAENEAADVYERAMNIYRKRGNLNGYAAMKMKWLEKKREVPKKYGPLTATQYVDSIYQLLQEVKGEEMGADVALVYHEIMSGGIDEEINFLRWAMKNVANSRRKGELQQELESALRPSVSLSSVGNVLADRPFKIRLGYWNHDHATVTVRQYAGRQKTETGWGKLLLTGDVVTHREVMLEMDSLNQERRAQDLPVRGSAYTELTLPAGHYVMVAEGIKDSSVQEFRVSTLHLMRTDVGGNKCRLYVMDNETGRPLEGVKVQCREKLPKESERTEGWENRDLKCELRTAADGTVELEDGWWFRVVRSERDHTDYDKNYSYWGIPDERKGHVSTRLMTDRSIYRPGQKVMGSVMRYWQKGDEVEVVDDEPLTLTIKDSQWKELTKLNIQTNEYGTASFEFTLPEGCAVGVWHLSVEGPKGSSYSETLRVEEYKRPTFDVSFDGKRGGKFGQKLEAVGTAMMLAGVPVQGAQVHYTVECMPCGFRWWWNEIDNWNALSEGDLVTDAEGQFRVPMFLTDEYRSGDHPVVRFRVKAQVTDMGGESHEAQWVLNVSDNDFSFDVEVKKVMDLAKDAFFKVQGFDVNHEKVEKEGTYKILYGNEVVAEGQFVTDKEVALPKNLLPGVNYSIEAIVVDEQGKDLKEFGYFTLYDSSMPVTDIRKMGTGEKRRGEGQPKEKDFFYSTESSYDVDGSINLYLSTEETDAYIIYNVYNLKGLLESHVAVTDGTMKHLRLQYQKEWGEGINVRVMYVRNGHYCMMENSFTLARPEKRLKLEWATFRDKLQPGQQEQWTLTVTDKDGKRVSGAEMMSVLYDASLDRLYYHSWSFYLNFGRYTPRVRTSDFVKSSFPGAWLYGASVKNRGYSRSFDSLKDFEHDRYVRLGAGRAYKSMVLEDRMVGAATMAVNSEEEEFELEDTAVAQENGNEVMEEKVDYENATIRENFAETAFFLPHLVSDKQGNVNIQFTLPESLTEWKFMGFAHTKDVDYGTLRATAVARKAFMLRPNMPRFVRWGDKAVIASSVVNQSEEALKGGVRLRLINPTTGEVVLTQEQPFAVEAGQTVGVDFGFDVKEEWQDLDCEIIAVSGNVSDGEKNPLPVLSTKKEIVEAVPYYIIGKSDGGEVSKTMDLSKLYNQNSATATNRNLKIEYTDNPAWMCIEALRSVKNPAEDDAFDYAASLYANTRLVELMQTFPVLEKHENLADLKQRVAIAEKKLAGLQLGDGGWSWFKGMLSSYYTTMGVCEHLAKLPTPNETEKAMLMRGMEYLDKHELDAYNHAKQKGWKIWPSNSEIRYLYLSAQMPDRPVSKEIKKMREEYLTKIEKAPRDLTIYGVANAAYTLRAFGHVKSADKFVNFLKDYTVEKPGQGRFYATDAAYYSWMDYRIPTQVAAMKAIHQKDAKDAYLNDMQLWLISQKQVQKWDNPMNTIDVADFLLQVSPMTTFHETKKPVLLVDGHELKDMDYGTINTERDELEGREANLILEGNVLAEVPEVVLKDGVMQLEVKKQTPSISWGAAYATFLEDVGNLKLYATDELKIQRKFYVQPVGSSTWEEYQQGQVLKVGEKLKIRHIITADRDMDFVRVSAQHPACLEPLRHLSGYQRMGGRGCYLSIHDSCLDMFFDWFTRGTSTVDMEYSVVRAGTYQVGVSSVECVYAKQFGGHTEGLKVDVKTNK